MPEDLSGLVTTPSTWIPRVQVPRQRQLGLGEDNATLLVANWMEVERTLNGSALARHSAAQRLSSTPDITRRWLPSSRRQSDQSNGSKRYGAR